MRNDQSAPLIFSLSSSDVAGGSRELEVMFGCSSRLGWKAFPTIIYLLYLFKFNFLCLSGVCLSIKERLEGPRRKKGVHFLTSGSYEFKALTSSY